MCLLYVSVCPIRVGMVLDGMIVISPMYVRMYVCTYFIYFYSISTYISICTYLLVIGIV